MPYTKMYPTQLPKAGLVGVNNSGWFVSGKNLVYILGWSNNWIQQFTSLALPNLNITGYPKLGRYNQPTIV